MTAKNKKDTPGVEYGTPHYERTMELIGLPAGERIETKAGSVKGQKVPAEVWLKLKDQPYFRDGGMFVGWTTGHIKHGSFVALLKEKE